MSAGIARSLGEGQASAIQFRDAYVPDAIIGGSIRRGEPEVHDIDLMTQMPLDTVKARIAAGDGTAKVTRDGEKSIFVTFNGFTINLYFYEPSYAGAMLFFLTGPKSYTIGYRMKAKKKGWVLNQYGLFDGAGQRVCGTTEAEIYTALDKEYKEPHLRGR